MGTGTSTSGINYPIGISGGAENVTLISTQLPLHNHIVNTNGSYDLGSPASNFLANPNVKGTSPAANKATVNLYADGSGGITPLAPAITSTGNNQPHENRMPFLVMNYCIASQGVYPGRN